MNTRDGGEDISEQNSFRGNLFDPHPYDDDYQDENEEGEDDDEAAARDIRPDHAMPIDLKKLAVAVPHAVQPIALQKLAPVEFPSPRDWQRTGAPDQTVESGCYENIGNSPDLDRIVALPRRVPPNVIYPVTAQQTPEGEALIELMTKRWSRGDRQCACASIDQQIAAGNRQCFKRFNIIQAWTLYEIGIVGGAIGAISVGSGKTGITIFALLALNTYDPKIRCGLLLLPTQQVTQLHHEYRLIREHFHVPEMRIHTGSVGKQELAPNMPMLHVRPYSLLSIASNSDWIRKLAPQAVISDECDKLKIIDGAGTSRVMRHFFERGDTAFVGLTGSLSDSRLGEYYHLMAIALKYHSPTPLDQVTVDEWERVISATGSPDLAGELRRLCAPGEHVWDGFRRRLNETKGVIIAAGASVDVKLVIRQREAPAIPEAVAVELNRLRTGWVRPDGEELVDAMAVAECALELACGMYYRWIFPRGEPEALIKEWLGARKDFHKEQREFLLDRREYLDSPALAEKAAMRHWGDLPKRKDQPEWQSYAWPRWRDVRGRVKPQTDAVWIDDFLVRDAVEWAHETKGIIWYKIKEFGRRIADLGGFTLHDGGPDALERLIGGRKGSKVYRGEDGARSIVCSIQSNGRGRDGMQRIFNNQLIANPPASGAGWEQMLGRSHRQGQKADQVNTWFYKHTPELQAVIDKALRKSEYAERTYLGVPQKIRLGGLNRE